MITNDEKLSELVITLASKSDLAGILALQAANQREYGGTLSASFSASKIAAMTKDMPLIVARHGVQICGFLMASSSAMNKDVPIIQAMLAAYPGSSDAYVYGPICVSAEERGKEVAKAMFDELKRLLPAREGILFIRCDNQASLRAHSKMGMNEVAEFDFAGQKFAVFSYIS